MRRREASGEPPTHGVSVKQNVNFRHGKSKLASSPENLFERSTHFIEGNGVGAQFSRPNKLNVMLIRCDYGLQTKKHFVCETTNQAFGTYW